MKRFNTWNEMGLELWRQLDAKGFMFLREDKMKLYILKFMPIGGCPDILGVFDDKLLAHTWKRLHIRGDHTCMNNTEDQYDVEEFELNKDSRFGDGWNPEFVKENWSSCKAWARHDLC